MTNEHQELIAAVNPPKSCQVCGTAFGENNDVFDAYFGSLEHRYEGWGWIDEACHKKYGVGLGTGKGQRFKLDTGDGKYYKVEG